MVYLAWENGDPFRLFFGTDSWGNTCGRKNTKLELEGISTPENSGKDLTDYKYVIIRRETGGKTETLFRSS